MRHTYLTVSVPTGDYIPHMKANRQVTTEDFFATFPVFSLDEAEKAMNPPGGRTGMVERLKHHLGTGRLKRVTRGVYAVVPKGQESARFQPDPFLAARAIRPDGVFCFHSALQLLGSAHSSWNRTTLFSNRRRQPLEMADGNVLFLAHPAPLRQGGALLGTRQVERQGQLLRVTGPERTLVEGFSRLDLSGGLGEFAESAGGLPAFDLKLLESVLERYATASLWAAVGWFLETRRATFQVPDTFFARLESRRPKAPQYLAHRQRTGKLASRWNLILPVTAESPGGPDER